MVIQSCDPESVREASFQDFWDRSIHRGSPVSDRPLCRRGNAVAQALFCCGEGRYHKVVWVTVSGRTAACRDHRNEI